jgi:sulfur carrier protein
LERLGLFDSQQRRQQYCGMKLSVNGTQGEFPPALTVQGLLTYLGFGEKPVVVEVNQRALFPRELAVTFLNEGDTVEIVQITAGG